MNLQRTAEDNFNLEGSATRSQKYPHQGKNNGFFLMRFLKIETKCSPKKSTGQVLATQTAEKGCCCFFRKGILSTKRRLWTNPRIFHTFCWWSKQASQTASILDAFQVCFQTRSAWHWSLPPFVWEISGSALVVLCIKKNAYLDINPEMSVSCASLADHLWSGTWDSDGFTARSSSI